MATFSTSWEPLGTWAFITSLSLLLGCRKTPSVLVHSSRWGLVWGLLWDSLGLNFLTGSVTLKSFHHGKFYCFSNELLP